MQRFVLYFFIFFQLWILNAYAQKSTKTVIDSRTKAAIDYVFIQSDKGDIKLVTNKAGQFILVNDPKISSFAFYKMGYAKKTISLSTLLATDTIYLEQRQIELAEVVVRNNKLDTLVKDKRYYVDDYSVLPDNNFLILTSKINSEGFELSYFDKVRGIRQTKKIKGEHDGRLVTDCFKNIHLLTSNFSRQIVFDSDSSFEFLAKYPRRVFDSTLAACVLRVDTLVIMKEIMAPRKIKLTYFDVTKSSPYINFYRVSRHARQFFYSAGYNARMREMIDNEIHDTQMMYGGSPHKMEAQLSLFFHSIARPLYAPMFLKNDTLVLFNFQELEILFFTVTGSLLKKINLDKEHFETKWDFEMIYDEVVQKFYMKIKTSDRASIKQVDIYSGKIIKTIKLEKVFARNVQIVGGRMYYLVREHEWDDTQYLYQQN